MNVLFCLLIIEWALFLDLGLGARGTTCSGQAGPAGRRGGYWRWGPFRGSGANVAGARRVAGDEAKNLWGWMTLIWAWAVGGGGARLKGFTPSKFIFVYSLVRRRVSVRFALRKKSRNQAKLGEKKPEPCGNKTR